MRYSPFVIITILCILLHVPGCFHHTRINEAKITSAVERGTMPPSITVWIHGTRGFTRPFFPSFFACPIGLNVVPEVDSYYHHRRLAELLCTIDQARFNVKTFYLFGWSGNLSFNAREQAALELYHALLKIIDEYKRSYGSIPYIRIITHSHGGNVALNLSHYIQPNDGFIVDELVLLACPVQEYSKNLVTAACFKKIYSLYSLMDSIQIADPQGLYRQTKQLNNTKKPFFSQRVFPYHQHLLQASIYNGYRGIMHIEYLMFHFVRTLPALLTELDRCADTITEQNYASVRLNIKTKTIVASPQKSAA